MIKKVKKIWRRMLAFLTAAAMLAAGFSVSGAEPKAQGAALLYDTAQAYDSLQIGQSYDLSYGEVQTFYALASERGNALLDSWREGVLQTAEGIPIFCIEADAAFSTEPRPTVYEGLDYLSQDLITKIALGLKWMEDHIGELSDNAADLYFFQQSLVWTIQDEAGYRAYSEPALYVPPYTASHNGDLDFACSFVLQAKNYADQNAGDYRGMAKVLDNQATQRCAVFKVEELPKIGGLEIYKESADPDFTEGNRCYSLEGAEFTLYKAGSETPVIKLTTDAQGRAEAEGLEAGSYEIQETKAPRGYLADSRRYPVEITSNTVYTYRCEDVPGKDPLNLLLIKEDLETGEPQAGAVLEGAEYTVKYYDGSYAEDPGEAGEKPLYTWVFSTDSQGRIYFREEYRIAGDPLLTDQETGRAVVPVGTLTLQETKAPEGYLKNPEVYVANTSVQNGGTVTTENLPNTETKKAGEQIIRGDAAFVKKDADSGNPMAGVPFLLTFETTGESRRVFTDENGYYSTSSSHVPHTRRTNAGTSPEDGIWFGEGEPDDSKGALLYGKYLLEEQPCGANRGKDLISLEFTVSGDSTWIDLGTLPNYTVVLDTFAAEDKTGTHTAALGGAVSVTDTVAYENLTAGREYTLTGKIMVKETGEELTDQGKPVRAEKKFTPEASEGTVDMKFQFDGSKLQGKTLVIFETLTWNGTVIAVHEDLQDENQAIYIPAIYTAALDLDTDSRTGSVREQARTADRIRYQGLTPGKSYKVSGTLMDRETGEKLLVNGSPVTAEKTFVPENTGGTVELVFSYDASELAGKTVTVFENIYYEEILVASHEELQDEEQTIYYPEIRTEASSGGSHEAEASGTVKIRDLVSYSNLIPGETYTLQGILMEASGREALTAEGEKITASRTFVPEQPSGTAAVDFQFRAEGMGGKTLVVFESLYHNEAAAAVHADLNDRDQTVTLKEPLRETPGPDTGDPTRLPVLSAVLAGAGGAALLLNSRRKKLKDNR